MFLILIMLKELHHVINTNVHGTTPPICRRLIFKELKHGFELTSGTTTPIYQGAATRRMQWYICERNRAK